MPDKIREMHKPNYRDYESISIKEQTNEFIAICRYSYLVSEEISKIMVCIDGSESSIKAAKRVLDMAEKYKAEVIAIHISFIPYYLRRLPQYGWEELHAYDVEQMKDWLKNIMIKANKHSINIKTLVKGTTSSVVNEIIGSADAENIDLFVLGSTGKSRLDRVLVGSVAQGVMTNAKCSVLVVR
jgi:nucleotide-binding universal stress UspA family protein